MLTDITVVLDRSGSMADCVPDTVGGFNTFVRQQKETGNCRLTLVQFDHEYLVEYDGVPIDQVKELQAGVNYTPRGSTALFDAVGRAVYAARERISRNPGCKCCGDVPKVIFVIITDGHENASREFTGQAIKELIEHNRTKHDWQFVFMGADVDAMTAGARDMGIHAAHTMSYNKGATGQAFRAMGASVNTYKGSRSRKLSTDTNFFTGESTTDTKVEINEDKQE